MASVSTIDDGNKLLNSTRASPVAIAAPTIAVRYARNEIDKTLRYPSANPAVTDAGKVTTASTTAHKAARSTDFPPKMATHDKKTMTNTDTGATTRNTNALFIEADFLAKC